MSREARGSRGGRGWNEAQTEIGGCGHRDRGRAESKGLVAVETTRLDGDASESVGGCGCRKRLRREPYRTRKDVRVRRGSRIEDRERENTEHSGAVNELNGLNENENLNPLGGGDLKTRVVYHDGTVSGGWAQCAGPCGQLETAESGWFAVENGDAR